MDVPGCKHGFLSVNVFAKSNLLGTLKKIFYKYEEFFIDYELEDKTILSYRFIMASAQDGLWRDVIWGRTRLEQQGRGQRVVDEMASGVAHGK